MDRTAGKADRIVPKGNLTDDVAEDSNSRSDDVSDVKLPVLPNGTNLGVRDEVSTRVSVVNAAILDGEKVSPPPTGVTVSEGMVAIDVRLLDQEGFVPDVRIGVNEAAEVEVDDGAKELAIGSVMGVVRAREEGAGVPSATPAEATPQTQEKRVKVTDGDEIIADGVDC